MTLEQMAEAIKKQGVIYSNIPADVIPVSVLQEVKWTPTSDRLPDKTGYYLIQYSRQFCKDEMAVAFYSVEEAEADSNYTWEFETYCDVKEVVAWRPLPEPYKEAE